MRESAHKGRGKTDSTERVGKYNMKESSYKSYDELPLFLNAATVAKVLGVSAHPGRCGLKYKQWPKRDPIKNYFQLPNEICKAPPIRRKEMQLLTREELQRLLIQAKDEGYYEVFLLELTTGLRVGELMALQWDDLNFKTGELRIERQVYRTKEELLIQEPKTKASILESSLKL